MGNPILIVGNVGAGKSTYANELSRTKDAYVFAADEWMNSLFMMELPDPATFEWSMERIERVEVQILIETLKLLERGIQVVLDMGFVGREQRARVMRYFEARGHEPILHHLDVDKETRWKRVGQRNTDQAETFQFHVSREVFEFCETIFEPLNDGELVNAIVLRP